MVKRALADVVIKGNARLSGNASVPYNFGLEKQHFVTQSNALLFPGPYSPFGVMDETFASGLGALSLSSPGSGMQTVGGGSLTYSAAAQTTAIWTAPGVHWLSPQIVVAATITAISNCRYGFGIGVDGSNRLNVEYDSVAGTLSIVGGVSPGTIFNFNTTSGFNPVGTFSVAFEVLHNICNIWTNTGSGWVLLDGVLITASSVCDMRTNGLLGTWTPLYYAYGSAAGAFSVTMTECKCTYFNGPGGTREYALVTNLDGSPYIANDGQYWIAMDRSERPRSAVADAQFPSTSFQVCPYNPTTRVVSQAIINIMGSFGGILAAAADGKVVYDAGAGGFHIFTPNWAAITDVVITEVRLYYAFVATASFAGIVNCTFTALTVPSDTFNALYGPDVIKIGSTWYLVCTVYTAGGVALYTRVLTGSAANNYTTKLVEDSSLQAEGVNFFRFQGKLYILCGNYIQVNSAIGLTTIYDFTDLTTLKNIGLLDVANPNTGILQPQQPLVVWYSSGGNGAIQYLGYQDTNVGGEYQASGPMIIAQSTAVLPSTQF